MIYGLVGCYRNELSKDNLVYFRFDDKKQKFIDKKVFLSWQNCKYLSMSQNKLVSITSVKSSGISYYDFINKQELTVHMEQSSACYICQDYHYIYTANYHSGEVIIYSLDSLETIFTIETGKNSGAHQVILYHDYILVPCLLNDCICIYSKNSFELIHKFHFIKDTGPRHAIIYEDKLFLVSELSNELFMFQIKMGGRLFLLQTLSLNNHELNGLPAAIRLNTNKRYLYISIREINCIKVIDINNWHCIQTFPLKFDHPRDILLSDNNQYLFIAFRSSNCLCVYSIHENGTIDKYLDSLPLYEPVSIALMDKRICKL